MIDVVAWRQAFFVDGGQACPETTRVIQVGLKELIATDAAVEWNVLTDARAASISRTRLCSLSMCLRTWRG
jgi:hypothetical protein